MRKMPGRGGSRGPREERERTTVVTEHPLLQRSQLRVSSINPAHPQCPHPPPPTNGFCLDSELTPLSRLNPHKPGGSKSLYGGQSRPQSDVLPGPRSGDTCGGDTAGLPTPRPEPVPPHRAAWSHGLRNHTSKLGLLVQVMKTAGFPRLGWQKRLDGCPRHRSQR